MKLEITAITQPDKPIEMLITFLLAILIVTIVGNTLWALCRKYLAPRLQQSGREIALKRAAIQIYIAAVILVLIPTVPFRLFLVGFGISLVWGAVSRFMLRICGRLYSHASRRWWSLALLICVAVAAITLRLALMHVSGAERGLILMLWCVPIVVSAISLAISEPSGKLVVNPVGLGILVYMLIWIPFGAAIWSITSMFTEGLLARLLLGGICTARMWPLVVSGDPGRGPLT